MTRHKQHIIQKVRAELAIPSNERSREKSEQLKRAVQNAIQSLEPVLDNMASDSLCRIDSLSVELTLSNSDFDRLEQYLEKELSEKILEVFQSQSGGIESDVKNDVEQVTPDQSFNKVLSYFLQTGRLPWWAEPDVLVDAERWLADLSAKDWTFLIRPLAQSNPRVIERFVKQFSNLIVEWLIQKMLVGQFDTDGVLHLHREILQFAKSQKIGDGPIRQIETVFSVMIIDGILSGIDQKELTDKLLAATLTEILEFTGESHKKAKVFESFRHWLNNSDDPQSEIWIDRLEILPENRFLIADKAEIEQSQSEQKKRRNTETFNKDEALTVFHAGVVLLHPFLKSLFKNLGFIEDEKFLNEAAQERAVCLLLFLATGVEEFPEHELLLPKFLCGWPIEVPINRFLSLNKAEKRECESVLSSCIQHWAALKNTSIDGLRQNFLQRDGILKQEEFGWLLYIEQKTQDILLEKLPWGLSVVKLKWMDEMLTINWH